LRKAFKGLSEFLILSCCFGNGSPEGSDGLKTEEIIEMDDLRARLDRSGLGAPASMAEFQAAIDSERKVIVDRLRDMEEDPAFAGFFSSPKD
jgi:hypothetical protein